MSEVTELREALDDMLNATAGVSTMLHVLADDRKDGPVAGLARRQANRLQSATANAEAALSEWWASQTREEK